jgi:hypothetical protein
MATLYLEESSVKLALSALVFSISLAMPLYAMDKAVAVDKSTDARSPARAEVQQLVERFRHALLVKDGEAMRGMFLPGGSGFRVLDRTSLAAVRAKNPEAGQFKPFSYEEFAKFLGTSPATLEETVDNVRIETDGTVGMVWFDYRFIADGKQSNHGVETWQVVRESDGWKISAMLFSVILDDSR